MISQIVFDLGKVLVPFDWEIALRRLRVHLPAETVRLLDRDKAAFKALFSQPARLLETGQIEFDRFHEMVEETLKMTIGRQEFQRIWCDIFWMNDEMVSLGENLSTRYGTWLASNTSRAHYEWILAKFPRVAFYRDAALSYELGVMKPSREYFRLALEQFDIDPREALFIDDLKQNVEGAEQAGMHAVLFQGYDRLVPEMKQRGIEVS